MALAKALSHNLPGPYRRFNGPGKTTAGLAHATKAGYLVYFAELRRLLALAGG